VQHAVLD
jgi:hypothetical protein